MILSVSKLEKSFHLYQQNDAHISVLNSACLDVDAGECVALTGPSGCGKSSLMRMIYGNYRSEGGSILIGDTDMVTATPRQVMAMRRSVVGYVSQILRVLTRISTIRVVSEPFIRAGGSEAEAEERAAALLARLRIPETLWALSPLTFSGGEQQRVAIARALINQPSLLLADEPTGNLDSHTGEEIIELLSKVRDETGITLLIATHDEQVATKAPKVLQLADGSLSQ